VADGRTERLLQIVAGESTLATRASERRSAPVFKYLLMLPDGEPCDPAAFVTAVPSWSVGETFMVAGGKQFRIVGINDEIDAEGLEELYERGFNGIWIVEPVND
jgi:hypothetical protein